MQSLVLIGGQHAHAKNVRAFSGGQAGGNGLLHLENPLKSGKRTPGGRDDARHAGRAEAYGLPVNAERLTLGRTSLTNFLTFVSVLPAHDLRSDDRAS